MAYLQARLAQNRARVAAAKAKGNRPAETVNLTDPDSRILPIQGGWVQGYNAQMAVNQNGVVVAAEVFNEPNDSLLYAPMIDRLAGHRDLTGPVGVVLADAGYCTAANLTSPGPIRLIATTGAPSHPPRHHRHGGPAAPDAGPLEAMRHQLRTPEGRRLYKQRSWTVEPGFGNIKANLGFTRFSQRGFDAVRAEWQLITAATNLLKLHRYHPGAIRYA